MKDICVPVSVWDGATSVVNKRISDHPLMFNVNLPKEPDRFGILKLMALECWDCYFVFNLIFFLSIPKTILKACQDNKI